MPVSIKRKDSNEGRKALVCFGTLIGISTLMCWPTSAVAGGESEACRWITGGKADWVGVEWVEGNVLHGARIIVQKPGWTLSRALEGEFFATCEHCPGGRRLATFWLSVSKDRNADSTNALLEKMERYILTVPPSHQDKIKIERKLSAVPLPVFGLDGRVSAGLVGGDSSGKRAMMMAFAGAEDCLRVFGHLIQPNAAGSEADIKSFTSAIVFQRYTRPEAELEPKRQQWLSLEEAKRRHDARQRALEGKAGDAP